MAFEGIVYPELVVRDLAEIAVNNFRTNPQVAEWALAARPEAERDSILTAIAKRPGKVRHGLSLEQEEDWQVTVMMASADVNLHTIGEDIGVLEEVEQYGTTLIDEITDLPNILLPLAAFEPSLVPPAGRLRINTELATYQVEGEGTVRLTNRGVQGTVADYHSPGTPVSFHVLEQQIGWNELVVVRCDVLSSLAGLNMALATTIKCALLLSRQAFEERGLTLKQITESEITPRPAQWPVYLLNRSLMVQCIREFALPERLPILTDVQVEVTDP